MPKLQVFEFVGQTDKPGLIHARHLQQFLRNHRATLQKVTLSSVLFILPDRNNGALGRTMKDLFDWIRTNYSLTTFQCRFTAVMSTAAEAATQLHVTSAVASPAA